MWVLVVAGVVLAGLVALWIVQVQWDHRQVQKRQREHAERRRAGELDGPESRTNPDLTPGHGGGITGF